MIIVKYGVVRSLGTINGTIPFLVDDITVLVQYMACIPSFADDI